MSWESITGTLLLIAASTAPAFARYDPPGADPFREGERIERTADPDTAAPAEPLRIVEDRGGRP